ncbi:MoeB/ThiF family adenylyltransferase [Saliterribacillus persicus]|nr:MoeB/ThiF family adenylyltransferase [Saliterribacillus persicus]
MRILAAQQKELAVEASRYHRQQLFEPIGENGQDKIASSHVLVIGVGALGSASAESLVRAGVGEITLIDRDYVEESNLQRQQLFTEADVENKNPKVIAAKQRLQQINSKTVIHSLLIDAGVDELERLAPKVDAIVDATDNFETRLMINDIAQKYKKPWIYGACVASYGVTFTVIPGKTPCLQCLMDYIPKDGATCDTVGIIAPAVQMVVAHQMTEVLKILVGKEENLSHKLIGFDVWKNERMELKVDRLKKPECSSCSKTRTYPNLTYSSQLKTAVLCGRNTVQIRPTHHKQMNFDNFTKQLMKNKQLQVTKNDYLLAFEIEEHRIVLFKDGRTLIHGTKDIQLAKKLYYQYVG